MNKTHTATDNTDYPYFNWDSSTGIFFINTQSLPNTKWASYGQYNITARLWAWDEFSDVASPQSYTSGGMIYDQFTIYLRDECYDMKVDTSLTITDDLDGPGNTASEGSRFAKELWEQQRYTIT